MRLSGMSVMVSPGTEANLIQDSFLLISPKLPIFSNTVAARSSRSTFSYSISEQSESRSHRFGSDRVSHDAMGASFGFGAGTSSLVDWSESDWGDPLNESSASLRSSTTSKVKGL